MTAAATIGVRLAALGDVSRVAELERASFADPWSESSFGALVHEAAAFFAVATEASEVAGYVVAWFAADEAEIGNLAVREPTRRRGIGATLLDAAIAEATRRGAAAVYLEVRDSNSAAKALYASRGFVAISRRRNYYRRPVEDAVVLRKAIGDDSTGKALV